MLFRFLPLNNWFFCQKIFLWRSSILGKLDYFCLTCVLFPLVDQPSLHLDNSHLKNCFQYNPTIMCSFNQISHSYQGGVAQIQQQILQGTLSKECCMHTTYHMFKQCLIVLRFKDAHSSNYNIFQEESCLHQRVLFPKYGSLSWKNIKLCIQKNDVQLWRTYFTRWHVPCGLHLRKYIVKRALHVQEGSFLT